MSPPTLPQKGSARFGFFNKAYHLFYSFVTPFKERILILHPRVTQDTQLMPTMYKKNKH